jgi:CRISPR/Cas system-associated endonuclease Cas1
MLSYDFVEPYRIWIDNAVKDMVNKKEIKPKDFTFSEDKTQLRLKDKAMKIGLNRFVSVLKPLEHQALSLIRTVENML